MNKVTRTKHPEERLGQVLLGKWRLDELVGIGAMAAVFCATHRNGKRVAIKMLHGHLAEEPTVVRRFLREGYAANRVGHPAVVSALDDNITADGCPFLVLDFIEGTPLDRLVIEKGPMTPAEVLLVADEVLDALTVAHDKGVLHRDLKPENLLLTPDGKVRILDFGIARVDDEESPAQFDGSGPKGPDPRLTLQGRAMGTPGFMPPEQAQGSWERVDARSDLWSLGATMFALLTGREVHATTKAYELLIASITKQAQPIREVMPELPDEVANIVDRALAFHPGDRFPSAKVMQEWVRDARAPAPSPSIPAPSIPEVPPSQSPTVISHSNTPAPPLPPGRWRRGVAAFSMAAVVALAAHVGAAKVTRDPRLPVPVTIAFTSVQTPSKLGSVLPHDAAGDLAEPAPPPVVEPKGKEITLPPIELEDSIDLDELEEEEDGDATKASQAPAPKARWRPMRAAAKKPQFLAHVEDPPRKKTARRRR